MTTEFLVHVVDDDDAVRDALLELLDSVGLKAMGFSSGDAFLRMFNAEMAGCLILDIRMPGMSGLEVQKKLDDLGSTMPIIFITGHGDVPMAVEAIKRGASEFIQKPFRDQELLDCVQSAMDASQANYDREQQRKQVVGRLETLTAREKEALDLISEGYPNKVIASKMNISQRTVENHRANLLEKMAVRSTAGLIKQLVIASSG